MKKSSRAIPTVGNRNLAQRKDPVHAAVVVLLPPTSRQFHIFLTSHDDNPPFPFSSRKDNVFRIQRSTRRTSKVTLPWQNFHQSFQYVTRVPHSHVEKHRCVSKLQRNVTWELLGSRTGRVEEPKTDRPLSATFDRFDGGWTQTSRHHARGPRSSGTHTVSTTPTAATGC